MGCKTTFDNREVVNNSKVVILAVKPHVIKYIADDMNSSLTPNHTLISILMGVNTHMLEKVSSLLAKPKNLLTSDVTGMLTHDH